MVARKHRFLTWCPSPRVYRDAIGFVEQQVFQLVHVLAFREHSSDARYHNFLFVSGHWFARCYPNTSTRDEIRCLDKNHTILRSTRQHIDVNIDTTCSEFVTKPSSYFCFLVILSTLMFVRTLSCSIKSKI